MASQPVSRKLPITTFSRRPRHVSVELQSDDSLCHGLQSFQVQMVTEQNGSKASSNSLEDMCPSAIPAAATLVASSTHCMCAENLHEPAHLPAGQGARTATPHLRWRILLGEGVLGKFLTCKHLLLLSSANKNLLQLYSENIKAIWDAICAASDLPTIWHMLRRTALYGKTQCLTVVLQHIMSSTDCKSESSPPARNPGMLKQSLLTQTDYDGFSVAYDALMNVEQIIKFIFSIGRIKNQR